MDLINENLNTSNSFENHVKNEDHLISKKFSTEVDSNQTQDTFSSIEKKAQELFEQNFISQAESLLRALHTKGLGTCRSYSLLGSCYYQKNLFKQALHSYKKALEIEPSDLETQINLSLLRLDLGDYQKGFIQYRTAFQTYLQNKEGEWRHSVARQHYKFGMQYYQQGYYHEALLEFLKVAPVFKNSIPLELLVIRCLWKLNQKKRAFQKLYELQKKHPRSTEVLLLMGDFYFDVKKITFAISQWEHVLKIDSKNQKALKKLSKTQNIQSVEAEEVPFA